VPTLLQRVHVLHLRNTLSVLTTSGAFIRFSCQIPADNASAPSSPAKAAADSSGGAGAGAGAAAAAASSNPFDFDVDFAQVQKRRERARAAKESAREEGKKRRAEEK
jgi:hypothetical protein